MLSDIMPTGPTSTNVAVAIAAVVKHANCGLQISSLSMNNQLKELSSRSQKLLGGNERVLHVYGLRGQPT